MDRIRSGYLVSTSRVLLMTTIVMSGCSGGGNSSAPATVQATGTVGAEQAVGERIFIETRFAQSFKAFLDAGGNLNDPNVGDPGVDTVETVTPGAPMDPGPFKGMSMNCRSCHFVDDLLTTPGGGMRAYADFGQRSPIPTRADGKTHAPRNSPPLVNATLDRPDGVLLHFDAEFNSIEDLVAGTFTGRNFGWFPGERAQAIAHIARVVRRDDGSFDPSGQFDGLSYRILFTGNNPAIPDEFRLPPEFRVFVGSGTDQEIFDGVVKVVAAYDDQQPCPLSDAVLLDRAIARFKTPGLRDLIHSAPYMHNGQFNTLTDIITFYRDTSTLARAGTLRNAAPELQGIALNAGDAASLVAFLRSLNEDYQ